MMQCTPGLYRLAVAPQETILGFRTSVSTKKSPTGSMYGILYTYIHLLLPVHLLSGPSIDSITIRTIRCVGFRTELVRVLCFAAGHLQILLGGFPKLGYHLGGPNKKDYSILGSI